MKVREVREVVRRLEARHARYAERAAVEALQELAVILEPHDNLTVAALVKRVKSPLQGKAGSAKLRPNAGEESSGRPRLR